MTDIFLSYRRSDAGAYVDKLDDLLVMAFGRKHVYRDVASIHPGEDWVPALERAIEASDVMLAVIGNNWVAEDPVTGKRRIANEDDAVRGEVSTAFSRKIPIIPLWVDHAELLGELPLDVDKIRRINAIPVSAETLSRDIGVIVSEVRLAARRRKHRAITKLFDHSRIDSDLVGNWVAQGGDAILQYTLNLNGTYEYTGILKQLKSVGIMQFERYHSGEYRASRSRLELTPFRSTGTRRDPESPEQNYINRREAVERISFRYRLEKGGLVLVDEKNEVHYQRL